MKSYTNSKDVRQNGGFERPVVTRQTVACAKGQTFFWSPQHRWSLYWRACPIQWLF